MLKKLACLLLLTLACQGFATQTTLKIVNHSGPSYIYAPFNIGEIAAIVTKQSGNKLCINQAPNVNACSIDSGTNAFSISKYASPMVTTYVCLSSNSQVPSDHQHPSCVSKSDCCVPNDCAAQIYFSNGVPVAKPIGGDCSHYSFPPQPSLTGDLQTISTTN